MKHIRKKQKEEKRYTFGRFIRDEQVVCIDHNNTNLGLVKTKDALNIAKEAGLELVVVSSGGGKNPSTCKIMDFGKYKYDQEKRDKIAKKKQRENAIKIKEVKFRPTTNDNDLMNKARQFQEFVDGGNRLKVTIMFKGREMAHSEIGIDTMNKFATMIRAKYDSLPSMTGRNLNAVLIKNETQEVKEMQV